VRWISHFPARFLFAAKPLTSNLIKGGNHMELVAIRAIDELGRLVIPKEVREVNTWREGTQIAIYIHGSTVLLETAKPGQEAPESKRQWPYTSE